MQLLQKPLESDSISVSDSESEFEQRIDLTDHSPPDSGLPQPAAQTTSRRNPCAYSDGLPQSGPSQSTPQSTSQKSHPEDGEPAVQHTPRQSNLEDTALMERRKLIEEQNRAYQESLEADRLKVT